MYLKNNFATKKYNSYYVIHNRIGSSQTGKIRKFWWNNAPFGSYSISLFIICRTVSEQTRKYCKNKAQISFVWQASIFKAKFDVIKKLFQSIFFCFSTRKYRFLHFYDCSNTYIDKNHISSLFDSRSSPMDFFFNFDQHPGFIFGHPVTKVKSLIVSRNVLSHWHINLEHSFCSISQITVPLDICHL